MDEKEQTTPDENPGDEDWRFAPPLAEDEPDVSEVTATAEESADEAAESEADPLADALDIDAALAAVSTLDDMLAEEEAAEQARIAREQAEEEARQQREERLRNPELFFPMPPQTTLRRGRLDSIIPALVLIGIGAWLTFTLTTTQAFPEPPLLLLAVCGGVALTLLSRWLASGRWAGGALFVALLVIVTGGGLAALLLAGDLVVGWPLLLTGIGAVFVLIGLLVRSADRRLLFPGLALIAAGLIGFVVNNGLIPGEVLAAAGALWPVVLALVVIILVLPGVFRRQRG